MHQEPAAGEKHNDAVVAPRPAAVPAAAVPVAAAAVIVAPHEPVPAEDAAQMAADQAVARAANAVYGDHTAAVVAAGNVPQVRNNLDLQNERR